MSERAEEIRFSQETSREVQNARGCIRTYTDRLVNPWQMTEDDIDIEDISYQLANETRYAGAVGFYCVGQHSLEVMVEAMRAGERGTRFLLADLLHDSEEAYFKDMPSPIKAHPSFAEYRAASKTLRRQIVWKYCGIHWDDVEERIKAYDHAVYYRERRSFDRCLNPGDVEIKPWGAGYAHGPFMNAFHTLRAQIAAGVETL